MSIHKSLPVVAAATAAFFLAGCGSSSTSSADDTRTRNNEVHITIHQDAAYNDPVIGWAVENGTPSKGNFHTDARFLEITVLGNADHPSQCAVTIEHVASTEPDEDAAADDPISLGDTNPKTERSYTLPCSERENSTSITWPDGSIAMTGHVEDETSSSDDQDSSSSDNPWSFKIDNIIRTPRITKFDPEDSFTWPSPGAEQSASTTEQSSSVSQATVAPDDYDKTITGTIVTIEEGSHSGDIVLDSSGNQDTLTLKYDESKLNGIPITKVDTTSVIFPNKTVATVTYRGDLGGEAVVDDISVAPSN